MGLLLRPDVYYAASPNGAHLFTHQGPLEFTGPTVHTLLDRVATYLDGRHSLEDLTASLAPERRRPVEDLISLLLQRGAVRLADRTVPSADADAVPSEIGYLDYFLDDARAALAGYHAVRMLVLGSGRLLAETAAAAAGTGLHRLDVMVTDDGPTDVAQLTARIARVRGDSAGTFTCRPLGDRGEAGMRHLVAAADMVLHVADRPAVERARVLEGLCADARTPLAQAFVVDGAAWIAPVGTKWTSGWRRLAAWHRATAHLTTRHSGTVSRPGAAPAGPAILPATAVATQLVHGAFNTVTGAVTDRGALTRLDLSTLHSTTHAFRGHPFAAMAEPVDRSEGMFLARIDALARGARLTEEEFSRRAASCVGSVLGMFTEPDERDFPQIPLHMCLTEVSDPVGLLGPVADPPAAFWVGIDFPAARYQAALRAFAWYGTLMVDPRRLLSADQHAVCSPSEDPQQVLSALRRGNRTGRVWAYGLADGRGRLLDARQVFPALIRTTSANGHAAGPYLLPAGTASGYDWLEAVQRGVLDQCRHLTLAGLATATVRYPRVDLARARLGNVADRYRAMLAVAGEQVAVYDITGTLGVPTVICCRDTTPVACASGTSIEAALLAALEQTLLDYQTGPHGEPTVARGLPPTAAPQGRGVTAWERPPLPGCLRGGAARQPPAAPALSVASLAACLAAQGHQPFVVPLDHDPEASAVMPYAVRVVLADA